MVFQQSLVLELFVTVDDINEQSYPYKDKLI